MKINHQTIVIFVALLIVLANTVTVCPTVTNMTICNSDCPGWVFTGGSCVSPCSNDKGYNVTSSSCVTCPTTSSACENLCPSNYWIQGGNSNSSFPGGNSTSSCLPCSDKYSIYCLTCSISICTACSTNYTLSTNGLTCVSTACTVANCIQCLNATQCNTCSTGFEVSPTGTCTATICSINYCSKCQSVSACSVCFTGYTPSSDSTVCNRVCNDPKCASCSTASSCQICQAGYKMTVTSPTCTIDCTVSPGLSQCSVCITISTCQQCASGYALSSDGIQCIIACPTVAKCDICASNTTCSICLPGFQPANSTACTPSICTITNCNNCSSTTTCQACGPNFILSSTNTTCVPSCVSTLPNCAQCSSPNACSICAVGYMLSSNSSSCVKLCTINNCDMCASATTCSSCQSGYMKSSDLKSCQLQCSVLQCAVCASATTCTNCSSGFIANGTSLCLPQCQTGLYLDGGSTCRSCQITVPNCQTCTMASSIVTCQKCNPQFFLTSTGTCALCSSFDANCIICTGLNACTSCAATYAQLKGLCVNNPCNVANCNVCQTGNPAICQSCWTGFSLNNGTCTQINCTTYNLDTCPCPTGNYLLGTSCKACQDINCFSCTATTCLTCAYGYYPLGNTCSSCSINCLECDAAGCKKCKDGFNVVSGSCKSFGGGVNAAVGADGSVAACDVWCQTCSFSSIGSIICLKTIDGYSISSGQVIKCDVSCLTCAPPINNSTTVSAVCLTCPVKLTLKGTSCIPCTDPNALTCQPSNVAYSIKCHAGYTAVNGLCKPCAVNCIQCDILGTNKCDPNKCYSGFVTLSSGDNCTLCYQGCSVCSNDDPNVCLQCGNRLYILNGVCLACSDNCATCTSSTICTACDTGYAILNNLCAKTPVFPCANFNATTLVCTGCFKGYIFSSGACLMDSSCNNNNQSTCTSCPLGQYIQTGKCLTCPTIANCLTCSPTTPTNCFACSAGFYLNGISCAQCPTGCSECSTATYCTKAASGNYLMTGTRGTGQGYLGQCLSPCATCRNDAQVCTSCISGYTITGVICLPNNRVDTNAVFKTGTSKVFLDTDPIDVQKKKILPYVDYMRLNLCILLRFGNSQKACRNKIRTRKISAASVIWNLTVDATGQSTAETINQVQATMSSNKIGNLQMLSVSSTAVNSVNADNSAPNLGLILGVSIPLLLLLLAIIYLIAYRGKNSTYTRQNMESMNQVNKQEI